MLTLARGAHGSVVVVTHGLVIHSLLAHRVALAPGVALPARIANASVTVIEDGATPRVVLLDCTAHLAGERADDPLALSGG
jgi:broad specificity phosphatase PhoE